MTDHKRLTQAIEDLQTTLGGLDRARRQLRDAQRGQPGSSFTPGVRAGGQSSPVEAALGLNHHDHITADQAAKKLEAIDKLIRQTSMTAQLLGAIVDGEQPKHPTDRDRREVERANNAEPDRGPCDHCTRHRPTGLTQDVHRTGTVAGNLPDPMALCRWCYDEVRRTGQLPTTDKIRLNVRRLQRA